MHRSVALHAESVQGCSGVHTRDRVPTDQHVERTQFRQQVRFPKAVDTPPHPDQATLANLNVQLLARHHVQQFSGGRQSAPIEQRLSIRMHRCSVRHDLYPCTSPVWIATSRRKLARFEVEKCEFASARGKERADYR